jgi:hypothetical protein
VLSSHTTPPLPLSAPPAGVSMRGLVGILLCLSLLECRVSSSSPVHVGLGVGFDLPSWHFGGMPWVLYSGALAWCWAVIPEVPQCASREWEAKVGSLLANSFNNQCFLLWIWCIPLLFLLMNSHGDEGEEKCGVVLGGSRGRWGDNQ